MPNAKVTTRGMAVGRPIENARGNILRGRAVSFDRLMPFTASGSFNGNGVTLNHAPPTSGPQ